MALTRMIIDIDENIKNNMEETCKSHGLNVEALFTRLPRKLNRNTKLLSLQISQIDEQSKVKINSEELYLLAEKISNEKQLPIEHPSKINKSLSQNGSRKTIEELFEGYDGDYIATEIDWGEPVGNEVW